MPTATLIPIDDIRLDGGTQPPDRLDVELVDEYAGQLGDGHDFPPLDVFYDGADYWLAHGFHRYHAHRKIESVDVPCVVHTGTQRDAILFACGANYDNGKRRTNADIKWAILTYCEVECPDCVQAVADACRVAAKTVYRYDEEHVLGLKRTKRGRPKKSNLTLSNSEDTHDGEAALAAMAEPGRVSSDELYEEAQDKFKATLYAVSKHASGQSIRRFQLPDDWPIYLPEWAALSCDADA